MGDGRSTGQKKSPRSWHGCGRGRNARGREERVSEVEGGKEDHQLAAAGSEASTTQELDSHHVQWGASSQPERTPEQDQRPLCTVRRTPCRSTCTRTRTPARGTRAQTNAGAKNQVHKATGLRWAQHLVDALAEVLARLATERCHRARAAPCPRALRLPLRTCTYAREGKERKFKCRRVRGKVSALYHCFTLSNIRKQW
jgi:hypothetical protein